jgi:hypothetical protein
VGGWGVGGVRAREMRRHVLLQWGGRQAAAQQAVERMRVHAMQFWGLGVCSWSVCYAKEGLPIK